MKKHAKKPTTKPTPVGSDPVPAPVPALDHYDRVAADYRAVANKLKTYVVKWLLVLGLGEWDLDVDYCMLPGSDDHSDQQGKAQVRWRYRDGTVSFFLGNLMQASDERLEYVVVHEFCHVIVNQMRGTMNWDNNDRANEEVVVTNLAKALMRADRQTSRLTLESESVTMGL